MELLATGTLHFVLFLLVLIFLKRYHSELVELELELSTLGKTVPFSAKKTKLYEFFLQIKAELVLELTIIFIKKEIFFLFQGVH